MSLDTFANLQTEIQTNWLNRTDLTAEIPTFIALCEAEMKRRLRRSTTRTTISISAEVTALPSDCAELRSIYLETGSATQDLPLRIGTPEIVAARRARGGAVADRPTDATIFGANLVVAPPPDQAYTARITYFTQLTPLSNTVTTNAILAEAPDAYLFGSLMQAEAYLEHDQRIEVWKQKFDAAIDQLNDVRTREEYGNGIRDIRLPRVFG